MTAIRNGSPFSICRERRARRSDGRIEETLSLTLCRVIDSACSTRSCRSRSPSGPAKTTSKVAGREANGCERFGVASASVRRLRHNSLNSQAVFAIRSRSVRLQSGSTVFGPVNCRYELDSLEYSGPATGTRKAHGKAKAAAASSSAAVSSQSTTTSSSFRISRVRGSGSRRKESAAAAAAGEDTRRPLDGLVSYRSLALLASSTSATTRTDEGGGGGARPLVGRPPARPPETSETRDDSYLVDPASSHMLVSKIKPCMSKHELLHSEAANGSLGHPLFLGSYNPTWITVVILELIHASKLRPFGERARLLDQNQSGLRVRTFGDSG